MSAYTPLEALLLFQYVSNYGLSNGSVFNKVSSILKKDQQIINGTSYDSGRLSPDALQDFFLRLLKDAKSGVQDPQGPNGDVPSNPRKRKAPSPTIPTIDEAVNHAHLLPDLIRDLYAKYRKQAIDEIEESERKYKQLRRELDEIESGAWNERLEQEINRGEWDHVIQRDQDVEMGEQETDKVEPSPVKAAGLPKPSSDKPVEKPSMPLPEPQKELERQEEAKEPKESNKSEELAELKAPEEPRAQLQSQRQNNLQAPAILAQAQPSRVSSRSPRTISPRPPPGQNQGQSYPLPSPYAHHPREPPLLAPSPNPRPQDIQAQNRPPSSPAMLPPPIPGVGQPIPPYPFPINPQPSMRQTVQNQHATGEVPAPQIVPAAGQSQSPLSQSPYANILPTSPSHGGGVMLEPWAVDPQTPTNVRPQSPIEHPLTQTLSRPAVSTPVALLPTNNLAPVSSNQQHTMPREIDIARMLWDTLPYHPPKTAAQTPSKSEVATRWTPLKLPARSTKKRKSTPERVSARSISPLSERAPSPLPETISGKPSRRARQAPVAPQASDSQPGRMIRSQARRGRGGSTASSAVGSSLRGRTRSQSVVSHPEDVSMVDNESFTGRAVKNEPSTPADPMDFIRPTIEGTPLASFAASGTRRAALQSNANKRKRGARDDSEASDMTLQPRLDKNVVVAVRNFHKTSATVMNDISSHKHASYFSAPVRERDAPGYKDIIRRPQDLKTIRAAIVAGNRAVTSIAASDPSTALVGSPRDAGGSVILPMSDDLVPPKGIVNSAQLEKEVMRVFVNAVMFNAGDKDLVTDARDMCESVERIIGDFRSVERSSGTVLPPPMREGSSKPRESSERQSEATEQVEAEVDETPAAAIAKRRR